MGHRYCGQRLCVQNGSAGYHQGGLGGSPGANNSRSCIRALGEGRCSSPGRDAGVQDAPDSGSCGRVRATRDTREMLQGKHWAPALGSRPSKGPPQFGSPHPKGIRAGRPHPRPRPER